MKIGDVMSRDVQVIGPDASLRDAALMMKTLDAGALPVAENDRLVGMITDRDIAVRGLAQGNAPETTSRGIMSTAVKYCYEHEDTAQIAGNMAELQVRRLPVVSDDKRLVGIVALADLALAAPPADAAAALHGISRPTRG